jgi:tRNA G18 (ribose-2'-O)-methylase SpoU
MENPIPPLMKPMIRIDDLTDSRLDAFRELRDADLRGARALFTVESERVLERFLKSGWPVESILIEEDVHIRLKEILDEVNDEVPVYVARKGTLDTISGYGFHRGALALGRRAPGPPAGLRLEELYTHTRCTLLAADGVVHVDNMGSLFRNAACLSASGILLGPGCADPLFRKTVRISSGHVFKVPWELTNDLQGTLLALKERHDFRIIGLELTDESHSIERMSVSERTILIVGSEGEGISAETRSVCDEVVHIPGDRPNDQDSLNVAVASAIGLYELGRRTRV